MNTVKRPKVVISGAAGGKAGKEGEALAYAIGRLVAKAGGILLTGATTGVPYAAARGAKSIGGTVVGFSPAASLKEHENNYHLPTRHHDFIFYTGDGYADRDVMLVDLSDIVIEVSGRVGTIHEFTQAFERGKIIGVLTGSGGTIDYIPQILSDAGRGMREVILSADPVELVKKVMVRYREINRAGAPHNLHDTIAV